MQTADVTGKKINVGSFPQWTWPCATFCDCKRITLQHDKMLLFSALVNKNRIESFLVAIYLLSVHPYHIKSIL